MSEELTKFKITRPLITQEEDYVLENYLEEVVNDITKSIVKDKDLALSQEIIKRQQKENQHLKATNESLTSLVNSCQKEIRDLQAIEKEHQKINGELRENYKAILRQRDDITKNATETIEKYQQKNQQLKEVIEEVRQLALKQIDISNKEIDRTIHLHHYDKRISLLIGQEEDIIKIQEKILQILDKAKGENNGK